MNFTALLAGEHGEFFSKISALVPAHSPVSIESGEDSEKLVKIELKKPIETTLVEAAAAASTTGVSVTQLPLYDGKRKKVLLCLRFETKESIATASEKAAADKAAADKAAAEKAAADKAAAEKAAAEKAEAAAAVAAAATAWKEAVAKAAADKAAADKAAAEKKAAESVETEKFTTFQKITCVAAAGVLVAGLVRLL